MKLTHRIALATGIVLATPALAMQTATARFVGVNGEDHGTATLTQTPSGVLIKATLKGLPAGEKGFHIHGVGECTPPFASAGGHFNPEGRKHGLMSPDGPHAGDMPNIHIGMGGELKVDVLNTFVTLEAGKPNSLVGGKGTSLMIHARHDDHASDPAGEAGARIACGVIE